MKLSPRVILILVFVSFLFLHAINWGLKRFWRNPLQTERSAPPLYPPDLSFKMNSPEIEFSPVAISTDSLGRILGSKSQKSALKAVGAALISNELTPAELRWTETHEPPIENWGFPYNTILEAQEVVAFLANQESGQLQTLILSDITRSLDRFIKRNTLIAQRKDFPWIGKAEDQRIFGEPIFSEGLYSFLFWIKVQFQGFQIQEIPLKRAEGVPEESFQDLISSLKTRLLVSRQEELLKIKALMPHKSRLVLVQDPIPLFTSSKNELFHPFHVSFSEHQIQHFFQLLWEQNLNFSKEHSAVILPANDCFKRSGKRNLFQEGFHLTAEGNKIMASCFRDNIVN